MVAYQLGTGEVAGSNLALVWRDGTLVCQPLCMLLTRVQIQAKEINVGDGTINATATALIDTMCESVPFFFCSDYCKYIFLDLN